MEFTMQNSGSTNFTKLAIVGVLHIVVGYAIMKSTDIINVFTKPDVPVIVEFVPEAPKPAEPVDEPPEPTEQKPVYKEIFVPTPIGPVTISDGPTITGTDKPVEYDPTPAVTTPPAKAEPAANPGTMRTAVFADVNACGMPDYPARSARNGDTGTVTLALLVGTDGRVVDSRVQTTSGFRELDRAAVGALSLCKFKPATNGGAPEQAWAQIAYKWTLD